MMKTLIGLFDILLVALCLHLILSSLSQADTLVGEAKTFACSDSEAELIDRGVTGVTAGNAAIYVGYRQLGNNKDPIAARFDGGAQSWCRTDYEVTNDDNTGYGLVWDGTADGLYAVFSATGTQGSKSEDFRRFAENGWLSSYTDGSPGGGGGPKVAIVAKMNPATGAVTAATFITARLSSGKTNSVAVTDLTLADNYILVSADSWYSPRNPDKSRMDCSGSSPFDYTLRLSRDLSTAITAEALGCVGNSEQPPGQAAIVPQVGFVGTNHFVATVDPITVQLPVTFTWKINGVTVRSEAVTNRTDKLTYTWAGPIDNQTMQVLVSNGKSGQLGLDAVSSPLYSFDVVQAKRVYLPLIMRQ